MKSFHKILYFLVILATIDAFVPTELHYLQSKSKVNIYRNIGSPAFSAKSKRRKAGRKYHITSIHARSEDHAVSSVAAIGFISSLGVLWSEYCILVTGCGPSDFSDALERICYQGVIVLTGIVVFNRIITGGKGLDDSTIDFFGPLEEFTLIQVRMAEYASLLAVLGSFVALVFQDGRGVNMTGISGVTMCLAWRDF